MVTTTSADSALRSYYLDAVAEQLNKNANPFLAAIEQTTSDVWGKDVKKTVVYGLHGGIGAGTEDGDLPEGPGNGYAQLTATLKNLYGKIEISDKAVRASRNDEGAFVDLLNEEMTGLVRSSSFNLGRMLFGDGTGKLATISAVTESTYTVNSTRNLVSGMIVDVISSAGATTAAARTIIAINRSNKTILLSGASITGAANCGLYVRNSRNLEITGLGAIFSESETLYGLSRAQNDWLKPNIISSVGTLTEVAVQKAIDQVEENSGGKINFIICSWGVRRALYNVLSKYRQCDSVTLEGGTHAITFNGIPVVADRFCPEGTMYLLNTDDFRLHQLCDWQWLEGENGRVLNQIPGKPVYQATLVKYAELMCYRPCGQAMLKDITEK